MMFWVSVGGTLGSVRWEGNLGESWGAVELISSQYSCAEMCVWTLEAYCVTFFLTHFRIGMVLWVWGE
jgi:hypothetical protein